MPSQHGALPAVSGLGSGLGLQIKGLGIELGGWGWGSGVGRLLWFGSRGKRPARASCEEIS